MFTIKRIGSLPIYHAIAEDNKLLALAFMRMQEYYESPVFRGTVFSAEEYIAWYTKEHSGFSYAEDWHGFNVPSDVVNAVLWNFSDHIAEEEMLFNALQKHHVLDRDEFYLIGSNGKTWEMLVHEVCHALYYLLPQYQIAARSVLGKYNLEPLRTYLKEIGYGANVIDDEVQAYSMAYMPHGAPRTREFKTFRRELKETLTPYLNEYLNVAA